MSLSGVLRKRKQGTSWKNRWVVLSEETGEFAYFKSVNDERPIRVIALVQTASDAVSIASASAEHESSPLGYVGSYYDAQIFDGPSSVGEAPAHVGGDVDSSPAATTPSRLTVQLGASRSLEHLPAAQQQQQTVFVVESIGLMMQPDPPFQARKSGDRGSTIGGDNCGEGGTLIIHTQHQGVFEFYCENQNELRRWYRGFRSLFLSASSLARRLNSSADCAGSAPVSPRASSTPTMAVYTSPSPRLSVLSPSPSSPSYLLSLSSSLPASLPSSSSSLSSSSQLAVAARASLSDDGYGGRPSIQSAFHVPRKAARKSNYMAAGGERKRDRLREMIVGEGADTPGGQFFGQEPRNSIDIRSRSFLLLLRHYGFVLGSLSDVKSVVLPLASRLFPTLDLSENTAQLLRTLSADFKRSAEEAGADDIDEDSIESAVLRLEAACEALRREGVFIPLESIADLLAGRLSVVLGFLQSMFFTAWTKVPLQGWHRFKADLLLFYQKELSAPRDPSIKYPAVSNFDSSWRSGLAFCALVHCLNPSLLPHYASLAGADPLSNLQIAMSLAATHLDIPQLLEPADLLAGNSDEVSLVLYLTAFFRAFLRRDEADSGSHSSLEDVMHLKAARTIRAPLPLELRSSSLRHILRTRSAQQLGSVGAKSSDLVTLIDVVFLPRDYTLTFVTTSGPGQYDCLVDAVANRMTWSADSFVLAASANPDDLLDPAAAAGGLPAKLYCFQRPKNRRLHRQPPAGSRRVQIGQRSATLQQPPERVSFDLASSSDGDDIFSMSYPTLPDVAASDAAPLGDETDSVDESVSAERATDDPPPPDQVALCIGLSHRTQQPRPVSSLRAARYIQEQDRQPEAAM